MRTIYGIVIKSRPVTIKLNGGGIIETQKQDLDRGTKVEIDWDYTTNQPAKIWMKDQRPTTEEPVDEEEIEIEEEDLFNILSTHGKKITPVAINVIEEPEQDLHWPEP